MMGMSKEVEKRSSQPQLRQWIYNRTYLMATSLRISRLQAIFLFAILQLQRFTLLLIPDYNPFLIQSPEMTTFASFLEISLLRNLSPRIPLFLLFAQLMLFTAYLLPIKVEIVNRIISNGITTLLIILTIPSLLLSMEAITINPGVAIPLSLLCVLNNCIYYSIHFESSLQQSSNALSRLPKSVSIAIMELFIILLYPLLQWVSSPIGFIMSLSLILWLIIVQLKGCVVELSFYDQRLCTARGVLMTLGLSTCICYLIVFVSRVELVAANQLVFIGVFFGFVGVFFAVFRSYFVNKVIIDCQLTTAAFTAIYIMWYLHCLKNITKKKHELYISSLLKNHSNNCAVLACCCKNRNSLFDSSRGLFGDASLQPHRDQVFMKHYLLRLLMQGVQSYPKSMELHVLLGMYYLEVMQFIPRAMNIIKRLNRFMQRGLLNTSEMYSLYCLRRKCGELVSQINVKQGDLNLEDVRHFDEALIQLRLNISASISMHATLWVHLHRKKLRERLLLSLCKAALPQMFLIEQEYKQLREINIHSTNFKALMVLYARYVIHDIHLLSEVCKEIKPSQERNCGVQSVPKINFFSANTLTLFTSDSGAILWFSRNAPDVFHYTPFQFGDLTVKDLMPKYFADEHDKYVRKWKEGGKSCKLNATKYLWGVTSEGYCFGLLIYTKLVSLPTSMDYAFFSILERIEGIEEIICGSFGQIYGAGERFCNAVQIAPRVLQEVQVNLQMFIPLSFRCFIAAYFSEKNEKNAFEGGKGELGMRCDGYFPENIVFVMRQIAEDRGDFFKRNSVEDSFLQRYLKFTRGHMQGLTSYINGEYISFSFSHELLPCIQGGMPLVVLKVLSIKKNTIEGYYNDLEKVIEQLNAMDQQIKLATGTFGQTIAFKKNKNNIFKLLLNPKKIKKIIQGKDELSKLSSSSISNLGQSYSKARLAHQKRMAIGAQSVIKNDRARYNIWRMKKLLYTQGIISLYTYNMLEGKAANKYQAAPETPSSNLSNDVSEVVEEASQDVMEIETFHSGSSSATFISMTNNVKMFKLKLRSLNTPKNLFRLNLVVLGVLLASIALTISSHISAAADMQSGVASSGDMSEGEELMNSLLLTRMISLSDSPLASSQQRLLLARIYQIFKSKMKSLSCEGNFLNLKLKGVLLREYILSQLDNLLTGGSVAVDHETHEAVSSISAAASLNSSFANLTHHSLAFFLSILLPLFAVSSAVLPMVHRVEHKMRQIQSLLLNISPVESLKYYRHFKYLREEICVKGKEDMADLNTRLQKLGRRQIAESDSDSSQQSNESSDSVDMTVQRDRRRLYLKIIGAFVPLMVLFAMRFTVMQLEMQTLGSTSQIFVGMATHQTNLTLYQLSGQNTSQHSDRFIGSLYDSYHAPSSSNAFKTLINSFINQNICTQLLNLTSPQDCQTVGNGRLTSGGIENIYSPDWRAYYYGSLAVGVILEGARRELILIGQNWIAGERWWSVGVACGCLGVLAWWVWIYLQLSGRASYTNAFLLLMPFDVLSENPYIRLYIKNQFDYKASNS